VTVWFCGSLLSWYSIYSRYKIINDLEYGVLVIDFVILFIFCMMVYIFWRNHLNISVSGDVLCAYFAGVPLRRICISDVVEIRKIIFETEEPFVRKWYMPDRVLINRVFIKSENATISFTNKIQNYELLLKILDEKIKEKSINVIVVDHRDQIVNAAIEKAGPKHRRRIRWNGVRSSISSLSD
jgi:hypothetical protein